MTPCRSPHLNGKNHRSDPSLNRLILFVERIGENILFAKDVLICELSARKLYDFEPRTEIVVMKD